MARPVSWHRDLDGRPRDLRGGRQLKARAALAQGRPVFLLESLLHQRWARELAERPGVRVACGPSDVVTELERLYAPNALVA